MATIRRMLDGDIDLVIGSDFVDAVYVTEGNCKSYGILHIRRGRVRGKQWSKKYISSLPQSETESALRRAVEADGLHVAGISSSASDGTPNWTLLV